MDSLNYFFDHLEIWGKWAAGGAAIIGFTAVFWKFFKGFLSAAKKTNIAITGFLKTLPVLEELAEYFVEDGGHSVKAALRMPNEILQKLENQEKKINEIQKEVTTNGGKSLKDIVQQTNALALSAALRTKHILELDPRAIYECSVETGDCTFANLALCELFGLSKEEFLGSGWLAAIDPIERQTIFDVYKKAVASDIPYNASYHIINPITGERFLVETEMSVLRDKNGKPAIFQGIVNRVQEDHKKQ